MKKLNLEDFDEPWQVIDWIYKSWGSPITSNYRWDILNLSYLVLKNESDSTFILLKFSK